MSALPAALLDLPVTPRMPVVFIGHGNPMYAIEDSHMAAPGMRSANPCPRRAPFLSFRPIG